jgi:transcription elongation GreA/GreB family factor
VKPQVIRAIRDKLAAELAAIENVAAATRSEVGNDETRQEGKYDTRATEASYLARGQAWRVVELRQLKAWFDALAPRTQTEAAVGALVAVDGPRVEHLFIAPVGGARVEVDGTTVRVISTKSPLGAELAGLEEGDGFEVETPRGRVEYEVLWVA